MIGEGHAAQRRGEQAAAAGEQLSARDRDAWVTIKVDEFVERYRPQPYDGPVLYFAAQHTPPWRSTEPWSKLLTQLEILDMDGSHHGEDGLLAGQRAEFIAARLTERLR